MDQIRDTAPAHERVRLPMPNASQPPNTAAGEVEEIRVASLEERLANWGSD
jgi:hypothetical protein